MSRTHELKTWPEPFQAVLDGRKQHEIRVDDRGFAVGDVLMLKEWDPTPTPTPIVAWSTVMVDKPRGYTGRVVYAHVVYLTPAGAWGLPANLCVMSIDLSGPLPREAP